MTEEDLGRITERIKREYRDFRLDSMRTSRENIFANAEEIAVKHQACRDICLRVSEGAMGEQEAAYLEGVNKLLDSVYYYYVNEKTDGSDTPIRGAYMRWLGSARRAAERQ